MRRGSGVSSPRFISRRPRSRIPCDLPSQEDGMRIDRQSLVRAIVGLWICAATAGLAHAQSFQGGLRGAVKDAQGVIPGVTVTLMNEANGVTRDTISNSSGEYSFPAVDPGNYEV